MPDFLQESWPVLRQCLWISLYGMIGVLVLMSLFWGLIVAMGRLLPSDDAPDQPGSEASVE